MLPPGLLDGQGAASHALKDAELKRDGSAKEMDFWLLLRRRAAWRRSAVLARASLITFWSVSLAGESQAVGDMDMRQASEGRLPERPAPPDGAKGSR